METIYAGLCEAGQWPTTAYVDNRLLGDHGVDIEAVLATLPRDIVGASPGYQANSKIQPALYGLRPVEAAAVDLQRFVDLVRFGATRELQTQPGPLDGGEVRVSNEDAPHIWTEPLPKHEASRLITLVSLEPIHAGMSGPNDDGAWSIGFDRRIRRYHDVQDIDDYLARRPEPPTQPWLAPPAIEPYIFVVMPFEPAWSSNVMSAIDRACEHLAQAFPGLRWQRADNITEPGRITDQIIAAIQRANLLIADITGSNPNVLFELGYADALERRIIVLNQDVAATPFDIKDWRQIIYSTNELVQLSTSLEDFVAGTLLTSGFAPRSRGTEVD